MCALCACAHEKLGVGRPGQVTAERMPASVLCPKTAVPMWTLKVFPLTRTKTGYFSLTVGSNLTPYKPYIILCETMQLHLLYLSLQLLNVLLCICIISLDKYRTVTAFVSTLTTWSLGFYHTHEAPQSATLLLTLVRSIPSLTCDKRCMMTLLCSSTDPASASSSLSSCESKRSKIEHIFSDWC